MAESKSFSSLVWLKAQRFGWIKAYLLLLSPRVELTLCDVMKDKIDKHQQNVSFSFLVLKKTHAIYRLFVHGHDYIANTIPLPRGGESYMVHYILYIIQFMLNLALNA